MTAFELVAFDTEVKPEVSGTSDPQEPGNPIQTAVSEPLFKCGDGARAEEFTENSSPPARTWTPKRVELLTQLFEEGLSKAEIARRLGLTKNAVIGRLDRMQLRSERDLDKWIASVSAVDIPAEPYTPTRDVFNGGGCLWPLGHPGEPGFHFCGAHSTMEPIRSSWCSIHSAIVYRKPGEQIDED